MTTLTPERIEELRRWLSGNLQERVSNGSLTKHEADIIHDLLALLDEKAEALAQKETKAGEGSKVSALKPLAEASSPGPSPELQRVVDHLVSEADERALMTLEDLMDGFNIPALSKYRKALAHLRSRLSKPAPPPKVVTRDDAEVTICNLLPKDRPATWPEINNAAVGLLRHYGIQVAP